jgi:hypothetical protein
MFIFRNVMTLTKLCTSISQFLSEIKSTNYCSDSDEFLVNFLKKQRPNLNAPSTSSLTLPTCSSTYTEHNSSLANENILHYIAASIVNSLLKKSMCTKCANWLYSEDNNHCEDKVFPQAVSLKLNSVIKLVFFHNCVNFAPTLEMSPVISTEQSYLTILTTTVQPINNRQTPLGTRIESTLFNIDTM